MLEIIRGATKKDNSTSQLVEALSEQLSSKEGVNSLLYIGYPILGTVTGGLTLDAVLISELHGMIVFDLIEGTASNSRSTIRDELFSNTKSRLIQYSGLVKNRELAVNLEILTYAPQVSVHEDSSEDFINNKNLLKSRLRVMENGEKNSKYFPHLAAAIQAVTNLNSSRKRSYPTKEDSRGAKLKALEESIANLDSRQNRAVIETAEGPQRIRGLAGSGKTIILALKAAYLHSRYPEWDIAITFNTRSLKDQFVDLVTKFTIEQKREEPDWEKIKIMHSWGSLSSPGLYYDFCISNGIEPLDFATAKRKSGALTPLGYASLSASKKLVANKRESIQKYDAILVDEAQDLSRNFLRLCYDFLKPPKRIIWAYDELQNLSMLKMPSPKQLFGSDLNNESEEPQQDIILERCYRNSRPVLVAAHALGFGTARSEGLVQMFDDPDLWSEIGYEVEEGRLVAGEKVVLYRSSTTSPSFLESHSPFSDLIQFKTFSSKEEQADWVVASILKNLKEEDLKTRDIVIVTLNPISAREDTAEIRAKLLDEDINTHLAGVTSSPDIFFADDSLTVTGIFRAKGNEAPMIYVVNSEYAFEGAELIKKRNMLFSAITRSKAWVRVSGCGEGMSGLEQEFNTIREQEFKLSFRYPTKAEMERMRIINRDLTESEKRKRRGSLDKAEKLIADLKDGVIRPHDIPEETRRQLNMFFQSYNNEQNSE